MIINKQIFFSGLAVMIILYLLVFNMVNIWPHYFHSDAAASIIINNEARHEGTFIPTDWYYGNGDLFHYSLLAAPFVEKENFSFSTHLAAEFFGLTILIVCSIYFTIIFFKKIPTRLIFISTILCGFSFENARFIFFEQSYLLIISLMLLASSLAYSLLISKIDNWRLVKVFAFGLVIVMLITNNPMRSITTIVPLAIIVSAFGFLWKKQRQLIWLCVIIVTSFVVGKFIYLLFSFNKTIIYGAALLDFITIDQIPHRLLNYLAYFVAYLGIYLPSGTINLGSILLGEFLLVVFLAGGFLLFLQRIRFRENANNDVKTVVFLSGLFIASFMISFILIILIKNLLINVSSIRYQIFSIILLFAWLIGEYESVFESYNGLIHNYFWIFISMIFVIIAFNVYVPFNLNDYNKIPEKKLIARSLEANNIKVAYGTYWNSSVVTVFSGSKVHVLPVGIIPIISHWKLLSSDRLWRNELLFDRSALVLTKAEYNYLSTVSGNFIDSFPGFIKLIAVNDNYYIATYKQNLAKYIVDSAQPKAIEKIKGEFIFHNCEYCVFNAATGSIFEISFSFFNQSEDVILSSIDEHPFNIGVSLLDADGKILEGDFARISFYRKVFPGEFIALKASIRITQKPGKYYLRFAIVREGVKWYLNEEGPFKLIEISVK